MVEIITPSTKKEISANLEDGRLRCTWRGGRGGVCKFAAKPGMTRCGRALHINGETRNGDGKMEQEKSIPKKVEEIKTEVSETRRRIEEQKKFLLENKTTTEEILITESESEGETEPEVKEEMPAKKESEKEPEKKEEEPEKKEDKKEEPAKKEEVVESSSEDEGDYEIVHTNRKKDKKISKLKKKQKKMKKTMKEMKKLQQEFNETQKEKEPAVVTKARRMAVRGFG